MVLQERVQIDEVVRDSLQSAEFVDTDVKHEFIKRIWDARTNPTDNLVIEATAFVSPQAIPQHKDAADLIRRLSPPDGVSISVLVPNMKGFEAAMQADDGRRVVREVAVFTAASESFVQHNMGMTLDESFEKLTAVLRGAEAEGVETVGYVSCVALCPYDGIVTPDRTRDVVSRLIQAGCKTIKLGATTGQEDPGQISAILDEVMKLGDASRFGAHIHDTDGMGMANSLTAFGYGIRRFDGSAGGIGATRYGGHGIGVLKFEGHALPSNVASDGMANMFRQLGHAVNVSPEGLVDAAQFLHERTQLPVYSNFALRQLALKSNGI